MFIETEERITAACIFYRWTKNNSNTRYTSMKFKQLELAKSRAMPPCVPTWSSMCQRGLRAKVLACQRGLRTNVAKACQLLIFTFQRVIRLAIFFYIGTRANKGAKFFKHFCYQVLRKISILYYYIKFYILLGISYTYHMYMYRK